MLTAKWAEPPKKQWISEKKNIQHRGFAGGHPPNYWSGPHWLIYGRADGIPSFPVGMVVCINYGPHNRMSSPNPKEQITLHQTVDFGRIAHIRHIVRDFRRRAEELERELERAGSSSRRH